MDVARRSSSFEGYPILLGTFDLGITYMIFAALGLVAWFFVRSFVAETKGRTLEEMSR